MDVENPYQVNDLGALAGAWEGLPHGRHSRVGRTAAPTSGVSRGDFVYTFFQATSDAATGSLHTLRASGDQQLRAAGAQLREHALVRRGVADEIARGLEVANPYRRDAPELRVIRHHGGDVRT